jgi:hypothetical protein
LFLAIQFACLYTDKTVALALSATKMGGGGVSVFDPRDSSGNPYNTGEPYIVELVLPEAVTSIAGVVEGSVFRCFTMLEKVSAAKVKTIGNVASYWCTALTTANIPLAATIGIYAFRGCTALTSLPLPATLPGWVDIRLRIPTTKLIPSQR